MLTFRIPGIRNWACCLSAKQLGSWHGVARQQQARAMVLVGTAILPHGSLAYDGDVSNANEALRDRQAQLSPALQAKFQDLYEGTCRAAKTIACWEPDLIVLSTPHGLNLTHSLGVYLGPGAEGGAAECWSDFRVNIEFDVEIAKQLLTHFRREGVPAEGILPYGGATGVDTLRWGEANPIWYILKSVRKKPKFVLLSQYRQEELDVAVQIEEQRLECGRSLARFINKLAEDVKVAVVISGDLSHTYETDCKDPLYAPDPSFSTKFPVNIKAALDMERAIQGWVKGIDNHSPMDTDSPLGPERPLWVAHDGFPWLMRLSDLNPIGYSCGMGGFIMLHAMMEWLTHQNDHDGYTFKPKIETYQTPSYFGMMAATFEASRN